MYYLVLYRHVARANTHTRRCASCRDTAARHASILTLNAAVRASPATQAHHLEHRFHRDKVRHVTLMCSGQTFLAMGTNDDRLRLMSDFHFFISPFLVGEGGGGVTEGVREGVREG